MSISSVDNLAQGLPMALLRDVDEVINSAEFDDEFLNSADSFMPPGWRREVSNFAQEVAPTMRRPQPFVGTAVGSRTSSSSESTLSYREIEYVQSNDRDVDSYETISEYTHSYILVWLLLGDYCNFFFFFLYFSFIEV